jgi:hypothetical protein
MAKGQKGMSGSDKGFAQIERDLRDAKRNGVDRRVPVTMEEQIAHQKYLQTFEGRFPNIGGYEIAVGEELKKIRMSIGMLAEYGIYQRDWKHEGYNAKIEPKEFARELRNRTGLY